MIIEVKSRPSSSLLRRIALVPLVLALAGCEKSPSRPEGTTPAGVRVVSGDGQTGAVGAVLEDETAVGPLSTSALDPSRSSANSTAFQMLRLRAYTSS